MPPTPRNGSTAATLAESENSTWGFYEIALQRAKLFKLNKPHAFAQAVGEAFSIARGQQWGGRVKRLKMEFPGFEFSSGSVSGVSSGSRMVQDIHSQRSTDVLVKLGLALANVFDIKTQVAVVLNQVVKLLGAERTHLFLFDHEKARSIGSQGEMPLAKNSQRQLVTVLPRSSAYRSLGALRFFG